MPAQTVSQPPPLTNGARPAALSDEERRTLEFYQQIERLRQDVLAGRHPQIKLPPSAIQQLAAQFPPQESQKAPVPTHNSSSFDKNARINGDRPAARSPNSAVVAPPKPPQNPLPPKPTSLGIDPVLLTKSDDLVKAERQLKRQRIERTLKEECERTKGGAPPRDRDAGLEIESHLNVAEVLTKAQEAVPPVSGLPASANSNRAASDSFDENSYYSSVDNSWSSEDAEGTKALGTEETAAQSNQAKDKQSAYAQDVTVGSGRPSLSNESASVAQGEAERQNAYTTAPESGYEEEDEDEAYSPPPADDGVSVADASYNNNGVLKGPGGGRAANGVDAAYSHSSINRTASDPHINVPVVTNHIQSPLAPQPARVSPLATSRLPAVEQSHADGAVSGHSSPRHAPGNARDASGSRRGRRAAAAAASAGQPSPSSAPTSAPRQPIRNPKKRRRDAVESGESSKGGRRASGKRVARSPDVRQPSPPAPYIKEEPLSPPPLSGGSLYDYPEHRRRIVHELDEPAEIISPAGHHRAVYYREYDPADPRLIRYDEPPSPHIVRVPSRSSTVHRRERIIEEPDLRRVASLQYARRPYSPPPPPQPQPYYAAAPASDPRPLRATSTVYAAEHPVYREASVRPYSHTQEIRYVRPRSRSPPADDVYTPVLMAPPPAPRTIVVDRYGNRYYPAPPPSHPPEAVPIRESVAPLPPRRREYDDDYRYLDGPAPLPSHRERSVAVLPARTALDEDMVDAWGVAPTARMQPPPLPLPPPPRRYIDHAGREVEILEPPPPSATRPRERAYSTRPPPPPPLPHPIDRQYSARPPAPAPMPMSATSYREYSARPPAPEHEPGVYIREPDPHHHHHYAVPSREYVPAPSRGGRAYSVVQGARGPSVVPHPASGGSAGPPTAHGARMYHHPPHPHPPPPGDEGERGREREGGRGEDGGRWRY